MADVDTGQVQEAGVGSPDNPTIDVTDAPWVTLKEASSQTGISVGRLRKWYQRGRIESRLEPGRFGEQRVVRLDEVAQRAEDMGSGGLSRPAQTLALPAERIWEMYQEAAHEAQAARERAAALEAEKDAVRRQLDEERAEKARLIEMAVRPKKRWWQQL